MNRPTLPLLLLLGALITAAATLPGESAAQDDRIFNTVKTKLAEGQPVIGGTVATSDPEIYCVMANAGLESGARVGGSTGRSGATTIVRPRTRT